MRSKDFQRGGLGIVLAIILVILLVLGAAGWFFIHSFTEQQTTAQTESNQPNIKVTDYSQGAPQNQKTAVVVEHSDSSFEEFILSNASAGSFVQHLPEGDRVISKKPLK